MTGLIQAHMALRSSTEGNEFAVISTWATPDATMAAFGPQANRVLALPGVSELLDFRTIEHFEVDESVVVHEDVPPALVRIVEVWLKRDAGNRIRKRYRTAERCGKRKRAVVETGIRERAVQICSNRDRFGRLGNGDQRFCRNGRDRRPGGE